MVMNSAITNSNTSYDQTIISRDYRLQLTMISKWSVVITKVAYNYETVIISIM